MEKSITLVIRSHGSIPITWKNNSTIGDIVPLINPNLYCKRLDIMSLSKLGGICYGAPNIDIWLHIIRTQYAQQLRTMNYEEFIDFFFVNPSEEIRVFNEETLGKNSIPELTTELGFTVDKVYSIDRSRSCNIRKLQSQYLIPFEEKKLETILENLNYLLNSPRGFITRREILELISQVSNHGVQLTLVDLTCDSLNTTQQSEIQNLTLEQSNWIIESLQCMRRPVPRCGHEVWTRGVRGGKKPRTRKKKFINKRKKNKSSVSKKKRINKK